jgi:hypothetical protein
MSVLFCWITAELIGARGTGTSANTAPHARGPFRSTEVDAPVPLQSPDQPVNV